MLEILQIHFTVQIYRILINVQFTRTGARLLKRHTAFGNLLANQSRGLLLTCFLHDVIGKDLSVMKEQNEIGYPGYPTFVL